MKSNSSQGPNPNKHRGKLIGRRDSDGKIIPYYFPNADNKADYMVISKFLSIGTGYCDSHEIAISFKHAKFNTPYDKVMRC